MDKSVKIEKVGSFLSQNIICREAFDPYLPQCPAYVRKRLDTIYKAEGIPDGR